MLSALGYHFERPEIKHSGIWGSVLGARLFLETASEGCFTESLRRKELSLRRQDFELSEALDS